MFQLTIDNDRCVGCGNCEAALPNLLGKFSVGRLLISAANANRHRAEIQRALSSCRPDALTLEEVGHVPG